MNKTLFYCILLVMFLTSGCVVRTYTTEMDRVDQEIEGNRGVIFGTPPAVEESGVKKTREIYNIEVELPSGYRTSQEIKDRELYGNRGYLQGSMLLEKEAYVTENESPVVRFGGAPQVVYSEPIKAEGVSESSDVSGAERETYIVQKGDTLQKISEKFFGTTKKWKAIYNANKDVLKSPDRIRPGQKLIIPR